VKQRHLVEPFGKSVQRYCKVLDYTRDIVNFLKEKVGREEGRGKRGLGIIVLDKDVGAMPT